MASADDHDACMIAYLQPFSQAIGSFSEEAVSKEFPSNFNYNSQDNMYPLSYTSPNFKT